MTSNQLELEKQSSSSAELNVTRLKGKLALETVHEFISSLRPEPASHLVLDMSGVSFLDSAGVGALVSLFVSRRHAGKTFALASMTPHGIAVMQVSGLTKLLPIFTSVEEATAQHV